MTRTILAMRLDVPLDAAPPSWPDGVSLAAPEPGRLEAAHALLVAAYSRGEGRVPPLSEWWTAIAADPEFDPALVRVALAAGRVVGFGLAWTSSFIKDLAVAPSWRGRGLGRAMLLSLAAELAARGAAHVDLKVMADNAPAVALYRSVGMRIVEEIDRQ